MDEHDLRRARNEALFRALNEQIVRLDGEGEFLVLDLVCECASASCMKVVGVPTRAYESVRASSTAFIVVPGHEEPDIEDVVERHDGYVVVDKRGDAAVLAERTDPRDS